ncbi:Serine-protein kinase RsbW [Streptomyces sp. RB5]|uniref:Serine-protein kinase RsbW n=1 Tax=Streptomyces smaragdinus TaxID=2585196 RepID=A0A7K0CK03_9ACTN|nr:ATP-binding protein [Streptomyces smaragdinus]MQY13835.1 Serine-protein kinase RsbW [Streptomyces smaragdinus]
MSIWWSLHLRREAASVPLARRLLVGAMDAAGVDPDISFDLSLALTEACANAVEHGGDAATDDYRVTAFIDGVKCRIEVIDAGPGFTDDNPSARLRGARASVRAEGGRGLYLIETLADHVDIHNRPGRGAVVSFDKMLKWREGALLAAS